LQWQGGILAPLRRHSLAKDERGVATKGTEWRRSPHFVIPAQARSAAKQPDGCSLGIACVEDKIVQQALVWVLKAIVLADFLRFDHGFRSGRSQRDALDAVYLAITTYNEVVDRFNRLCAGRPCIIKDWLQEVVVRPSRRPRRTLAEASHPVRVAAGPCAVCPSRCDIVVECYPRLPTGSPWSERAATC
jgi:hypothetical protein